MRLDRQISQTDGRGNTSQIIYDAQGRVAKTIDALGHETAYAYDVLGRQVAVTGSKRVKYYCRREMG